MARSLPLLALFFFCLSLGSAHNIPDRLSRPIFAPSTVKRATSEDPSCPAGYLCDQEPCPSSAICPSGEMCVNFEGTLACVPQRSSWCALNPDSFQGVGCWDGICCHGQCYTSNAVCCDNSAVRCTLGQACNVCPRGQECAANGGCSAATSIGPDLDPTTTTSATSSSSSVPTSTSSTSSMSQASSTSSNSTTTAAPTSSSTWTAPPSPTTVAAVDPFQSPTCVVDSTDNRVLVNGSVSDLSSTGITVEKCLELGEGWQYAGVEYGGECFWGDFPVNLQTANPADCNQPCSGNPQQLCGSGNRMIMYQDPTWVVPTRPDLAAQVDEYLELLAELQGLIQDWNDLIEQAIAQANSGSTKMRRQVNADLLAQIATARNAIISLRARWTQLTATITRHFKTGDNYRILEEYEMDYLNQVYPPIDEQLAAIGSDVATVATSGLQVVGTLAGRALVTIGKRRIKQGGIIIAAATGIFTVGYELFDSLFGGDDNTPPPVTIPPTTTPEPTKTSTSTSSSSTCTYTEGPMPVIVVTKKGTTMSQFQGLVNSLPVDKDAEALTNSYLPNWCYIGKMDRCAAEKLWDNPYVEAMSLNRPVVIFEGDDVDPATLDLNAPLKKRSIVNVSDPLSARTLGASKRYVTQADSGVHLRWLSGQSRQKGNIGQFYDFEDYLFDDRSLNPAPAFPPRIYIIDTYFLSTHQDFSSRVKSKIAVTGDFGDVSFNGNSHGTCMTSIAAGTWTGVYKDADIVLVQAKFNSGQEAVAIDSIIKAYSAIMNDVQALSLEGNAVVSQSFGVPVRYLWFDGGPAPIEGTQNTDAIGVYLNCLFEIGVAAAASSGNYADNPDRSEFAKLEAQSPRRNGGTNSPLVVVGNADYDGNRVPASNWEDPNNRGILTLYAPGVNILCAVRTNTNAWAVEEPGTSQATAVTAGLMAYFLSDPVLQAQFTAGGNQNMPMRLKQHLITVSTQQKGIGGWGDLNTDNVPRLANGENVECTTDTVQGAPAVPAFVMPPVTATGKQLVTSVVSEGLNVVLPAALRVSLFPLRVLFGDRELTLTSLRVTTASR
ncbi:hypothetical protein C8A05DRAFT_15670 [Staphylotrichum tortipilum]|uniref:WSC domain-containing protein n=1 Tax=Staphylotrichum tortipilum TaxID=2831512 RepID=A0AAN6MJV0_9PEZI|nr:hypothetical protein C8A05DRAFT_15670 [Staphylotrichum longicolle]